MGERKIRVLIANSTRILRDLLYDAIRKQPGIEIVGDVSEDGAIATAAQRTNADCVIVPLGEAGVPLPICAEILSHKPQARIVAIGEGTNVVALYWKAEDGEVRCTYSTASKKSILRAVRPPAS